MRAEIVPRMRAYFQQPLLRCGKVAEDRCLKTSLFLAFGQLMSCGYTALNIPKARRLEFNLALDELFRSDDATTLMDFLYDCLAEFSL